MATTRFGPSLSPCNGKNKTKSAMAAATTSPASLSLRPLIQFENPKYLCSTLLSCSSSMLRSSIRPRGRKSFSVLAVVDEESVVAKEIDGEENANEDDGELQKQSTPCELYVCNLPRSCDISELLEMFRPFGTVISVEVSRKSETGVSRGCGYVTMNSILAARKAITVLDGSDVGGREMRVRFSVDMSTGSRNPQLLNSGPRKIMIYESPHKLYVGNIRWGTKPEDLRELFSQFGTLVSTRVLYDRKGGSNRTYGFLSYSSAAERDAALSLDETEFNGRVIVVRKGIESSKQD